MRSGVQSIRTRAVPSGVTHWARSVSTNAVHDLLCLAGQVSQSLHGLLDARVVVALEHRQQLVSNTIPRMVRGRIGRVFAKRLLQIAQIRLNLRAIDVQQRPHHGRQWAEHPDLGDTGQATQAGSSDQAVQDGFDLVVGRVGGRDVPCAQAIGRVAQELIPLAARRSFSPCATGRLIHGALLIHGAVVYGTSTHLTRQLRRITQPPHKRLIFVRLGSAPTVVEMCDHQATGGRIPQVRSARSRATLSRPPETATITTTSCHWSRGQAAATRCSKGCPDAICGNVDQRRPRVRGWQPALLVGTRGFPAGPGGRFFITQSWDWVTERPAGLWPGWNCWEDGNRRGRGGPHWDEPPFSQHDCGGLGSWEGCTEASCATATTAGGWDLEKPARGSRKPLQSAEFFGNMENKLPAGLLAVCAVGRWAVAGVNQQLLNKRWRYVRSGAQDCSVRSLMNEVRN